MGQSTKKLKKLTYQQKGPWKCIWMYIHFSFLLEKKGEKQGEIFLVRNYAAKAQAT